MNALKDGLTYEVLVPGLVLFALFVLFAAVLFWAQANPSNRFDISNFLKDEQGKESSGRAFGFVALAIHSWWVATLVFQKLATIDHFLYYGLIWAGTPAIMVLANRWGGNLPFSQPGSPPTFHQQQTPQQTRQAPEPVEPPPSKP